jgi:outer membrane receptor protein involved in Fe transport
MKFAGRILIALLACTLVTSAVLAQTTRGDIQGVVRDETGEPLPGVTVSISSESLQGTQNTVTDALGQYKFLVLPPGDYKATYSLSGYQTREQENIGVRINSTTKVDVIMTSAFTEEVVVTSESPLVDTTSTTVGVDVGQEFFNSLPTGRNYSSIALVTPGAQTDDSGTSFYGSTGLENSYYIDGANTTGIELGQQGTNLNFEFIDEVQVKSGAYSAEYGRATGSMINVITKSGGNEFHGDVFGYYTGDSMQADKKGAAAEGAVSGSRVRTGFTRSDYGADLGGYIVKDRLWFFVAYDRVDNTDDNEASQDFSEVGGPTQGQSLPTDWTRDLWSAKLTWRITANQSLSLAGFGDPQDQSGALNSLAGPPTHYEETITTGGDNYSFNYDGIFGQNLVLSARWAQHNEEYTETGAGIGLAGFIDRTDPLGNGTTVWGWPGAPSDSGYGFIQDQVFSRDQYNVDLSYYVGNLAGSHEFKVGYEYEDIGVTNIAYYSGPAYDLVYRFQLSDGTYYYNHEFFAVSQGDPTEVTPADVAPNRSVDTPSKNYAWYIQDTWQVASNLSLDLGIRNDRQKLYNLYGEVSGDIKDEWAPRIGFVWDALGNGKSKVFGHWGYFFETIPMDIVIRSFGGEINGYTYNYSETPGDVYCDPDFAGSCRIRGFGLSPVDPNTKGQYIQEFILGGEYEFAPNWAAGIKYINRDLPRIIEDALTGTGGYYIGNPSEGLMTETFDLAYWFAYYYTPEEYPPDGLVGAGWCLPEGGGECHRKQAVAPERKFTGIELTLQKRFSNNFQFLASLLWSKLEGNYDGTFQASTGQQDPNLNSAYDYYDFSVNNTGKLSNDRPFQFKFDGSYRFDFGLNIGLSTYYRDGTPITAMGYNQWYRNWELYLSDRGAFGHTDSQWEADLHFGYPIKLGSSLELNVLLDFFNVFNRQGEIYRDLDWNTDMTLQVLDWHTGKPLPPITPADVGSPEQNNDAFNTSSTWQNPRSYRLGVRLSF